MKDFRAASPQRGSWQSQRRGRAASPVMIGADWKSTEIICCPQGAMHHFPKWCIIAPYPSSWIGRIIPDVQLLEEILNNLLYVGLHAKNLG